MLPARGNYADLAANVAALLDGEICYAIDQDQYYQKEGSVLVSVGASKAQGALADTALQDAPSDGSEYVRKDGSWAVATGGGGGGVAGVSSIIAGSGISVDSATGDVTITATGGGGGSGATQLNELSDVDLSTPATTGDVLLYDGSQFTAFAADQIPNSVGAQPRTTFTLAANGTTSYLFSGPGFTAPTPNPMLTLVRGQTYVFSNTTGSHPFEIQDGDGNAYDSGVTNNNTIGDVIFVVPFDAPDLMQYQCTAHSSMAGPIVLLDAAVNQTPPPLGALSDVDTDTVAPADGEALVWNAGTSTWVPGEVAGGGGGDAGVTVGPFTPKSYHTFESTAANAANASVDLQDWDGPVASDLVKVGSGAADGRPTSSGCEARGDWGTNILNGGAFSIAFWYMHDGGTTGGVGHYICGCTKSGVNQPTGLVIKVLTNTYQWPQELEDAGIADQNIVLCNGSGQSGGITGAPGVDAFDGNWHHYIFTHDGNGLYKTFVDGVEVHANDKGAAEDFTDAGIYGSHDGEFTTMGCRDDSCRNYGILDNFAVYEADITAGASSVPADALLVAVDTPFEYTVAPPLGATTDLTDFDSTAATAGQVPLSDGSKYVPTTLGLGTLGDTDLVTTPAVSGDALVYDGTNWVPGAGSGGSSGPTYIEHTIPQSQIIAAHTFQEATPNAAAEQINMASWNGSMGNVGYGSTARRFWDFSASSSEAGYTVDWPAEADTQGIIIQFDIRWDGSVTNTTSYPVLFGIGDDTTNDGTSGGFSIRLTDYGSGQYASNVDDSIYSYATSFIYLSDDSIADPGSRYIVGTKPFKYGFDFTNNWDEDTAVDTPKLVSDGDAFYQVAFVLHTDENGVQDGRFSCYVNGELVDYNDRRTADVDGYQGPLVTGGAGFDKLFIGAPRGATYDESYQLDNVYVAYGQSAEPGAKGIDYVETQPYGDAGFQTYQTNPILTDRTFRSVIDIDTYIGSLKDVSDAPALGYGQVLGWNDTYQQYENMDGMVVRSVIYGGYGTYPYSSDAVLFKSQRTGNVLIDADSGKMAVYTGPIDYDSGSGGWMEWNINPLFPA